MRLTKRLVEALEVTGKRYTVFDDDVTGLGIRVGISGEKAFYYVYRNGKGRSATKKWLRLGTFPTMAVEQARTVAKNKAAQVVMGEDPAQEVKDTKNAFSIAQAMELFFEQHDTKIKEKTAKSYHSMAERFVIPAFGKYKIKDIAYKHCANLHHSLRDTPYQANRCIALLSKFFTWCEKNGYRERGTNPVIGIEKFDEQKRVAFMGRKELEELGNAFTLLEKQGFRNPDTGRMTALDPIIASAIKMLLFTGARCMEILTLKWEYIDFDKGVAHLPDSKTGAKMLQLPPPALTLLEELPRINEYCFCGRHGKGHIVNIKDTWKRLLITANLSGWRIHDLRHAFASYAASEGQTLHIIGAMLGHTQASTTQRYAHLQDNPIAKAAAETANKLQADLLGKPF